MPNTKVLVNFVQDRSGSMGTVWPETLNGFKSFVEDLQKKGPEDSIDYLFSLTVFDTVVDCPFIAEPIANIKTDALAKFGPRGSTALYDAVGKTIENTAADSKGAAKIIFVIVTDGQENSSREWSKDALNQVIESKLNLGNWTFSYLGTQPETWDDAQALGIAVGATAGYQGAQASAAYGTVSHALHAMAAGPTAQSRSLLASHGNMRAMRAAGMTVRPGTPPRPGALKPPAKPIIPRKKVTKPTTPKRPSARWR